MTATQPTDSSLSSTSSLGRMGSDPGNLLGRKMDSTCSPQLIFSITLVIGIVLTVLGTLALIGHFAPVGSSGFAFNIQTTFHAVAASMGSDPYLIAVFTIAFGTAFIIAGAGSWIKEVHANHSR